MPSVARYGVANCGRTWPRIWASAANPAAVDARMRSGINLHVKSAVLHAYLSEQALHRVPARDSSVLRVL
jgi:hypothetical protein